MFGENATLDIYMDDASAGTITAWVNGLGA